MFVHSLGLHPDSKVPTTLCSITDCQALGWIKLSFERSRLLILSNKPKKQDNIKIDPTVARFEPRERYCRMWNITSSLQILFLKKKKKMKCYIILRTNIVLLGNRNHNCKIFVFPIKRLRMVIGPSLSLFLYFYTDRTVASTYSLRFFKASKERGSKIY